MEASWGGGNAEMSQGYPNLVNRGPLIFVSLAYRVGIIGFYSTRDSVVPGNAGLTDLVVGLKWVQK